MAKLRINLQHFTLLGFECAKFCTNKNKNPLAFYFVLPSPCTTLLHEVRLRLGNKNKNPLAFYFVLPSPCTNFAHINNVYTPMKHVLISAMAFLLMASVASCGGNKTQDNVADADSTQTTAHTDAPYADPGQQSSYTATLGGKTYGISIHRQADQSLPVVTDELGKKFYDNRVDVVITCDNAEFFKKSYTKEAFAGFLTASAEAEGTVLLGMAFDSEKSDGHAIRLGAQIGQVGVGEGPAFTIEIPLDGGVSSIVRDNNQDTTGNDMTD